MRTVPLGEVAAIRRNAVDPSELPSNTPYLGLEHIERGGRILSYGTVNSSHLKSMKYEFLNTDVLFGKLRPNLGKICRPTVRGVCSTDILPIHPGDDLDRGYLAHYLCQPGMVRFAATRATGANLPRLSPRSIEKFLIPLPSLEEQRRIAAILDKADSIRAKRRQALDHLDALTQSIFHDMFGNPVSNPRGLPTVRLSELGKLDRGVSKHRPRNDPALLGGKCPLIQTGDVSNSGGYIDSFSSTYSDSGVAQSKIWPTGTLCITIAANIAKTGILTFDACFPDSVVGFRSDPETIVFVQTWMGFLQAVIEADAPQSAQKNINLKVLRDLEVPLPSRSERGQYFRAAESVLARKRDMKISLEKLDELFASLQSRAFTGEL